MGCFWGAERIFWQADGVCTTAVGYAGGHTPNPTYEEVCSARTGHTEAVLVVFDPAKTSYEEMLQAVLGGPRPDAGHAPGQRRRHPVPLGDPLQHRAEREAAEASRDAFGERLRRRRLRRDHDRDRAASATFYYAEDYHQQYLAKVPNGYCGLGGTGVSCPIGLGAQAPPRLGASVIAV